MPSRGATIATLGLPAGKFIVTVTAEAVAYLNATASVNACTFTPAGTGYAPYGINVPGTGATVTATTGIVLKAPGSVTFACNVGGPAGNNGLILPRSITPGAPTKPTAPPRARTPPPPPLHAPIFPPFSPP